MPSYELVCSYCGNRFEIWVTVSQKEKGPGLFCENRGSKRRDYHGKVINKG